MAAARAAWPADAEAGVGGIAPERLVFLDECGVLTGMARLHGRSPRGTRASGEVPHGSWTRLSVLGALGREGMLAAMSVQAATDGAVFRAYLERVLLPELRRTRPDAVLVMDNLGAHKTPKVRELLDGSGFPALSGISCAVGHDRSEGAPTCHDAKSRGYPTPFSTSCWPAPIRSRRLIRTAFWRI